VSASALRRHVGMVFQRPNPLPISIKENVVFGLRSFVPRRELKRSMLDEAVESSLRAVGLWDGVRNKLHRLGTDLSLEQQQKLCIARLLPLKPSLLLMDEPCSALDAEGIAHIEALIESLKQQYTIIVVTHSMAQAQRISQRCALMMSGEVVEYQATDTLFAAPQDERTVRYPSGRYA
jgi:phosphate transport system ATP-binding protein